MGKQSQAARKLRVSTLRMRAIISNFSSKFPKQPIRQPIPTAITVWESLKETGCEPHLPKQPLFSFLVPSPKVRRTVHSLPADDVVTPRARCYLPSIMLWQKYCRAQQGPMRRLLPAAAGDKRLDDALTRYHSDVNPKDLPTRLSYCRAIMAIIKENMVRLDDNDSTSAYSRSLSSLQELCQLERQTLHVELQARRAPVVTPPRAAIDSLHLSQWKITRRKPPAHGVMLANFNKKGPQRGARYPQYANTKSCDVSAKRIHIAVPKTAVPKTAEHFLAHFHPTASNTTAPMR